MKEDFKKHHSVMKDAQGRFRTTSLFWETRREAADIYPPLYSVKEQDHTVKGVIYPSLRKIYLSYDHVPGFEYEFAIDIFGSWEHWVKISMESSLSGMFQAWRDELEIKIKATAIQEIIKTSLDPRNKQQTAASRWLAEKGYSAKRGRPSNEEVVRERKIQAQTSSTVKTDMERLGLSIVSGGNS